MHIFGLKVHIFHTYLCEHFRLPCSSVTVCCVQEQSIGRLYNILYGLNVRNGVITLTTPTDSLRINHVYVIRSAM